MRRYTPVVALVLAASSAPGQVPDPTRPPTQAELAAWRGQPVTEAVRWRLESVLISDARRVAVINGRRVRLGDRVNGARVTAIEPTHAMLALDTEDIRLPIQRHGVDGREQK